MTTVDSDVFANSPLKGKDAKKGKDVKPKGPHTSLEDACPILAKGKGGESTKAKVTGRGKAAGGGKATGRGKNKTSEGEDEENNDEKEEASATVVERFAIYICL